MEIARNVLCPRDVRADPLIGDIADKYAKDHGDQDDGSKALGHAVPRQSDVRGIDPDAVASCLSSQSGRRNARWECGGMG